MTSRWSRVLRGVLVASFAVFTAMFSHMAGGGSAPGLLGLVLALTFGILVSVGFAGRRMSLWRLSVSVTLSQLVFHLLFAMGTGPAATVHQQGHHGAVTMTMAGMGAGGGAAHLGGWMLVAHAVAAVVTIAFLWRGERTVWRIVGVATERLVAVLLGILVTIPARTSTSAVRVAGRFLTPWRDDLGVVLSPSRHRGPPVLSSSF
jgi:hypothetical protein